MIHAPDENKSPAYSLAYYASTEVSLATLPAVSAHSFCHPPSTMSHESGNDLLHYIFICRATLSLFYLVYLRFGRSRRHWVVTAACCSGDFFSALYIATILSISPGARLHFSNAVSAAAAEKQRRSDFAVAQEKGQSRSAAKGEAPRAMNLAVINTQLAWKLWRAMMKICIRVNYVFSVLIVALITPLLRTFNNFLEMNCSTKCFPHSDI